MTWSASACPGPCASNATLEELLHSARHLMFRAYASTGFTLWSRYVNIFLILILNSLALSLRNSETSSIKNKHYHRDCEIEGSALHDRVYLVNRKGWTRESGNTAAASG